MTFRAKICILGELQLNAALIFYLLGEINMKKLFLLFIAMVVVGMIGCAQENTELRWDNQNSTGDTVRDITWLGATGNETWNETVAVSYQSSFKEVDSIYGQGECYIYDSDRWVVADINNGEGIKLSDGSSNTYTINQVAKK